MWYWCQSLFLTLFQRGRIADGFPARECAGGSEGWQVCTQKPEVHTHSKGSCVGLVVTLLQMSLLAEQINVLQEY